MQHSTAATHCGADFGHCGLGRRAASESSQERQGERRRRRHTALSTKRLQPRRQRFPQCPLRCAQLLANLSSRPQGAGAGLSKRGACSGPSKTETGSQQRGKNGRRELERFVITSWSARCISCLSWQPCGAVPRRSACCASQTSCIAKGSDAPAEGRRLASVVPAAAQAM